MIEREVVGMIAICSGCGITSENTSVYHDDNPVEEDGTYSNCKFVCDACYCRLIDKGMDIGSPTQLQEAARQLGLKNDRA